MFFLNGLQKIIDDGGVAQRGICSKQEEWDEQEYFEPWRTKSLWHSEPEEADGKNEQEGENEQQLGAESFGDRGGQFGTDDGGGDLDGGENDGMCIRNMVTAFQRGDGERCEHDAAKIDRDACPYLLADA